MGLAAQCRAWCEGSITTNIRSTWTTISSCIVSMPSALLRPPILCPEVKSRLTAHADPARGGSRHCLVRSEERQTPGPRRPIHHPQLPRHAIQLRPPLAGRLPDLGVHLKTLSSMTSRAPAASFSLRLLAAHRFPPVVMPLDLPFLFVAVTEKAVEQHAGSSIQRSGRTLSPGGRPARSGLTARGPSVAVLQPRSRPPTRPSLSH
jgi:hypothetical protein